jgi:hypothetical protein
MLELLDTKDDRLRFEVIRYVWDRLEGKPFVAVNPAEQTKSGSLSQDNRLQMAINTLVVQAPPKRGRPKRIAQASATTDGNADANAISITDTNTVESSQE